jgi:hypothetical protein
MGPQLLGLVPAPLPKTSVALNTVSASTPTRSVAEVYALLTGRRRRGGTGRPEWLCEKIYELVRRVVGWNQ